MKLLLASEVSVIRRIYTLAGRERRAAVLVVMLSLVAAIFEGMGLSFLIPLVGVATGEVADLSIPVIGPILAWLGGHVDLGGVHIVGLVIGFFTLGIVVNYLNLVVSTMLAMRFAHGLRQRVFETALDRPLSEIETLPEGKLVNNLATETWQVCDALFVLISVVVQVVAAAVFLSFLFMLSPFYTLVLLSLTLVMAVLVHLATRAVRELGTEGVAANEAFMAYVWGALGGLRVIRGFGREEHERARFTQSSGRVRDVFIRLQILSGLVGPITQVLTMAMIGALLAIAILRGDPFSTLVGFLAIAYRMQPRISGILQARTKLRGLEASVTAIEEALADQTTGQGAGQRVGQMVGEGTEGFAGMRRGVIFEDVSARYPNAERPALHQISCGFRFGAVTAVAGYSGAGKSTLVGLLLRFIPPESGRILIDGVALDQISPESWHRRIAFVEQNSFLFNATVRDNIGYGDLEADDAAIREAARIAQADSFITELPHGYDTRIGDHGVRLSMGQRQRIALARALLRKPDVLILDEATNALDRPTERALRDAIESGRAQRAVIVIAHRRETIENADHVIVIDAGRVVQTGTPTELARAGGVYARLYLDAPGSQSAQARANDTPDRLSGET